VWMALLGNVFRRSVPGFPTSPLSPATTHVVLRKENHTQLTEAATLDRKSGGAEGSAVPRTSRGNAEFERKRIFTSSNEPGKGTNALSGLFKPSFGLSGYAAKIPLSLGPEQAR
jgi:hypothetical protein